MDPERPKEATVSIAFAELGGRTEVTVHHGVPASLGERVGCRQGRVEMLERLAAYVTES